MCFVSPVTGFFEIELEAKSAELKKNDTDEVTFWMWNATVLKHSAIPGIMNISPPECARRQPVSFAPLPLPLSQRFIRVRIGIRKRAINSSASAYVANIMPAIGSWNAGTR